MEHLAKQAVVQGCRVGEHLYPVIRSSICTGEQVAGFKDLATGKFQELMLIRDQRDLQDFLRRYQVEEPEIRREW